MSSVEKTFQIMIIPICASVNNSVCKGYGL